ncbi:hypothetical protein [Novosphingobium sp. KACC 22771]|uniref:hypothetical protein n=1 Tax=Novosphingobium sp. KACC 22771 TaxID=3025670 RepID=UPI002366EB0D|nr:hypothetical protein [Novosphingobium sp. KACC 22771]WDF72886.1 hypothetical protein PQ467_02255 [Novosphingobium sp. KACC 22771]
MATKHTSAGQSWQGITHHPLFATVVPLWLAATFALSTLAVRGELIERIVLAAKLDLILPMATPPLGTTARLLLAVAFGLLGALLGWLAVRMMAPRGAFSQTAWQQARREARKDAARESAPLRRRSADAHPDFPARQPIQAHAELGAHGFDNDPAHAPAAEPAAPGPQMTEAAPGPSYAPPPPVAETWQVLHDVPPPPPPAEEPSWDWKPQSTVAVMEKPVESKPVAEPAIAEVFAEAPIVQPFRFFKIDPVPAEPVEQAAPVIETQSAPEPAFPSPVMVMEAAPQVERETLAPEPVPAEPVPAEPVAVEPIASAPKSCAGFPSLTLDGPSAADHIASASLDSLSHVELLARLSLALQRHQNASQEIKTAACEPTLAPAPDGTGDALRAALASLRDVK